MSELLDIVNENDEVIGQIDRDDPDRAGKLYRMIFVGFYTPEKNIILQKRSLLKKSSPGLLTATVSGHVSSGQTYDEAALRESLEETGTTVDQERLYKLGVAVGSDAMRAVYAYPFEGTAADLTVEEGEGDGFIEIPIKTLREERLNHPEKLAPFLKSEAADRLLDFIEGAK